MARITKTIMATAIALAASGSMAAPDMDRRQPQVEKIVSEISPQRIEGYIRKLVGFKTRHTRSETESDTVGIGAARRWIKAELERCGAGHLNVAFDSHIAPVSARISR